LLFTVYHGTQATRSIRKNASTKARGCPLRRDEILLIRKLGSDKWKELKDIVRRRIAEISTRKISSQRNSEHTGLKIALSVRVGLSKILNGRLLFMYLNESLNYAMNLSYIQLKVKIGSSIKTTLWLPSPVKQP